VRPAGLPVRGRRAARAVCVLHAPPGRAVPAALAGPVRRFLRRGAEVEAVLAEISAVNAELLARRELS
jgi:hypothetical protein